MIVYDLGANVGFYSLLFSRLVGPDGLVHAFEPYERNLAFLKRHVELNRATNVTIHGVAVGRRSCVAEFEPGADPCTGRIVTTARGDGITVPMISLDEFVYHAGNPAPHVVKMDIEGGESDALSGMEKVILERRPLLLIAIHGPGQWNDCHTLLAKASYEILTLGNERLDLESDCDEIIARPSSGP